MSDPTSDALELQSGLRADDPETRGDTVHVGVVHSRVRDRDPLTHFFSAGAILLPPGAALLIGWCPGGSLCGVAPGALMLSNSTSKTSMP